MKKFCALFTAVIMSITLFAFASCNKTHQTKLLSQEFGSNVTIGLGEEIIFPEANLVNNEGNPVSGAKITYVITEPNGQVHESEYGAWTCNQLGVWKVKYVSGNVSTQEYTFTVADLTLPEIIFGTLPSDIFVGDSFTVPAVDYVDANGVDYERSSETLYFNNGITETEVTFNSLTRKVTATECGIYTLKVDAYDIAGNHDHREASWLAKDASWIDQTLSQNFIASFGQMNYLSYIRTGFINSYWKSTSTAESFLESYQGAEGVIKTELGWSGSGHAVVQIKLAEGIDPNQSILANDGVVMIRMRIDDTNSNQFVFLATGEDNYDESLVNPTCVSKTHDLDKGRWMTLSLSAQEMRDYGYLNAEGKLDSFQIGLVKNLDPDTQGAKISIYLDSITYGKKLAEPSNFQTSGKNLVWSAVEDAIGYLVYDGEEVIEVDTPRYTLKAEGDIVKVKAIGDGVNFADSEASYSYNFVLQNKILADFSCEAYEKLVGTGLVPYQGAASVTGKVLPSFEGKNNVLRVDTTANGMSYADFIVKIPFDLLLEVTDFEYLYITMYVPNGVEAKHMVANQYGTTFETLTTKGEWITIKVPKEVGTGSFVHNYRGKIWCLQFGVNAAAGSTVSLYFSQIWYQ